MKGDFTRFPFEAQKHFTRVLKQQGRVDLDADWNELVEILTHLDRTQAIDVIGRCGVPIHNNGFRIELDPNGADGYLGLAFALTFAGRPQEAIPLLEKSMHLNPNYTFLTLFNLGHSHFLLQQYDDAITALERGVLRNPNFAPNYIYLAASYAETGREQEARANLVELQNRGPDVLKPMLADLCPYKRAEDLDHLLRALGKAGLPE